MRRNRHAAGAPHLQPAPVWHRWVRPRTDLERHRRERRLANRRDGPEQLQPENARGLPPFVGGHLRRWALSSPPPPNHHSADFVALGHSPVPVWRKGKG